MKRWCVITCLVISLAGLVVFTSKDVVFGLSGPNLLVNAGFEAATADPWSKYGGVFDIVTALDPIHGGNQAARHGDTTSDSTKWLRQSIPVTGGLAYEFSAWAYLPATSGNVDSVFLRVAWYASSDCSGSQSGTADVGGFDASVRDTWQQLKSSAVAPQEANCVQLRLVLDPASGQDPVVYWDDAFLGSQDTPTDTPIPTAGPTPTHTPTSTSTPSPTPVASSTPISTGVTLNEYLPAPTSGESEYVELFNTNPFAVDISGWQIDDIAGGSSPYTIPAGSTIPANGLYLVTRTFGLNNSGDTVRLLAPDGSLRDSHSFTDAFKGAPWSRMGDGGPTWTDKYPQTPGAPNLPAVFTLSGHLYLGQPPDASSGISGHYIGLYGSDDPDVASQWLANASTRQDGSYSLTFDTAQALYRHYTLRPSILAGHHWSGADTTFGVAQPPDRIRFDNLAGGVYPDNLFWMAPEPTPTLSPTPLPPDFVAINECLPSPRDVDFDGNGVADYEDEYIELYNPQAGTIDLGGWWLDDGDGGSQPYQLPAGTTIPSHGFLLFFRSQTGIALNNDGDSVRLLAPDGASEADRFDYDHSSADTAWSRSSDGDGDWTESYSPSPGGPNLPPPATPTPTITPTITPGPSITVTPTLTPTATPSPTPDLSPSPSPTATITPTPTPALPSLLITINEFLPAPRNVDWNGDGEANLDDEYIELYNPNGETVDLSGWLLDDADGGSAAYTIQSGTAIPAHGFLLFFRSDTGIALNNNGDDVRLFDPHDQLMDQHRYERSRLDVSWSRTTDGGGTWTDTFLPSPGGPNIAPTATATLSPTPTPTITPTPFPTPADGAIALNEILTSPKNVDWDGDGVADYLDEWIEIYNGGNTPADLTDWRLWRGQIGDDGLPEGHFYELPTGSSLSSGGFMLIFRNQSDLYLPASDGDLHLVQADGRIVDSFTWSSFPGFDRSFSRYPDGDGSWKLIHVTPGQPNRPFPPSRPTPPSNNDPGLGVGVESIARAHQLAADTRVTVEGAVTVLPGLFNDKTVYIQDATSGLKLYLRRGSYPDLRAGDRLRVTGYLRDYHGQRELSIPGSTWLTLLGPGPSPRPRFVRTGAVGEAYESRLVMAVGQVTGFKRNSFWLDDGSGGIKVTVDSDLPWQRPYFEKGDTWAVVGVVSQYDDTYRINPRYQSDISPPPSVLPVTGSDLR